MGSRDQRQMHEMWGKEMTITAPDTALIDYGDYDDVEHAYCDCLPDTALCGVDLTGSEDTGHSFEEVIDPCVVCDILVDQECERCGE